MREDALFQQAMSAVRAGRELTARDILLEIVEINPRHEAAWMWLTGLLDDLEDCIYACQRVLDINPRNDKVGQYLEQLLTERKKQQDVQRLYMEEQVAHVRELVKSKRRDEALEAIRLLTMSSKVNADGWRLLAELSPEMDERLLALEKLVVLAPEDVRARQELERLQHFKNNPLDLAAMYEEEGNFEKAIEAYNTASLKARSKSEQADIYWKTLRIENLRQEKITHISPAVSIARLTAGPPLIYFMLLFVHLGMNPITNRDLLLSLGFFWVLVGGYMIALASVRSHSRLWSMIFKDVGSGGSPAARFIMAAAGWVLIILPFMLLFFMAYRRLYYSL